MKLLVLSLGTGAKNNNQEKLISKESNKIELEDVNDVYRTAYYRISGKKNIVKSPFVAEILIDEIKPDSILIIGTGKSAWEAFYRKYHKNEEESKQISEIIKEKEDLWNKDKNENDLDSFQSELNSIFNNRLELPNNPYVEVCLIKYGINDKELNYNYKKLFKNYEGIINKFNDEKIEVSFDITHSFRSLPLYNLVVLNYYKQLSNDKEIEISHIYYGNLDVSRENKVEYDNEDIEVAEVVDLKNLIDVLSLTNGMSEFINTGNADTLVNYLKSINDNKKDKFINELNSFNNNIRLGKRDDIISAWIEISRDEMEIEDTAMKDALVKVKRVLEKTLPRISGINNDRKKYQKELFGFQLALSEWCNSNGQVGLAAAIAKECFRSFLVSVYDEPENYENENARRRVEQCFENNITSFVEEKQDSLIKEDIKKTELFLKYKELSKKVKDIRNLYAHNLSDEKITVTNEDISYDNSKKIVNEYLNIIRTIIDETDLLDSLSNKKHKNNDNENIDILIGYDIDEAKDKCEIFDKDKNMYFIGLIKDYNKARDIRNIARRITRTVEDYLNYKHIKVVWLTGVSNNLINNSSIHLRTIIKNIENIEKLDIEYIDEYDNSSPVRESEFVWNIVDEKYKKDDIRPLEIKSLN